MSRLFYHICQDNAGNLLFDVTGTMRLAGSGTLATIYGDEALTVILPNPMTNHPSFASFKCFLGSGDYDFYMAKAGYTFETLTGVQGHGTLAQQDAGAVAITGGTIVDTTVRSLTVANTAGNDQIGLISSLNEAGGTGRALILHNGTAQSYHKGSMGFNISPPAGTQVAIGYNKSGSYGLWVQALDNDTGGSPAVVFVNTAASGVGTISTTATTTTYNTTSDARLKEFAEKLVGSLDIIRVLNPISFLWKSNNERGEGLAANELQQVIPYAVTGEPDAINDDGSIIPQQVDYSKLVPRLVGAIQELLARVEALEMLRAP